MSVIVLTASAKEGNPELPEKMVSLAGDRAEVVVVRRTLADTPYSFDQTRASSLGLPDRLLAAEGGTGLKEAIRLGIEAARGGIIAFAEPGDSFPPEALPGLLSSMREKEAQILHCATRRADGSPGSEPWADGLEGSGILLRYLTEEADEDALFGKFYDRELCLRAMESGFPPDGFDAAFKALFAAALHFHAARYAGSPVCGYVRRASSDAAVNEVGRLMILSALFHSFVPYCAEQGASFADCGKYDALLEDRLVSDVAAWLEDSGKSADGCSGFSRFGSEADALRAIVFGHPFMQAARAAYLAGKESRSIRRRFSPLWRKPVLGYAMLKNGAARIRRKLRQLP